MTCLIDTNSLIYYYRNVRGANTIQELLAGDGLVFITSLTIVEVRSTLAKLVRDDSIAFGPREYSVIDRRFSYDWSSLGRMRVQPIRRQFVSHATQLIEEYGVRRLCSLHTLDSLHLSAAIDLQSRFADLIWVTADQPLQHVAASHGITVCDPRSE